MKFFFLSNKYTIRYPLVPHYFFIILLFFLYYMPFFVIRNNKFKLVISYDKKNHILDKNIKNYKKSNGVP